MILLTDVATKLQTLLNSFAPSDYSFVVKSQGYHLDKIDDIQKSRNTIPVFISMVGGEYNPVPNLHQINFTYEIIIYFPVRFKKDFYNLNVNLEQWFVGQKVDFGSQTALCNISVAEYGEIVGIQVTQFENWVAENYEGAVHIFKKEEEVNEPYMSMTFRLFCTTLGDGFLFGNDVKYNLSIKFPVLLVESFEGNRYFAFALFTRDKENDVDTANNTWRAWKVGESIVYTLGDTYEFINGKNFKIYNLETPPSDFVEIKKITDVQNIKIYPDDIAANRLSANLVWDSAGTGASISPISEQLIGVDRYARNTPNITNFNKSIVVYIDMKHNNNQTTWFWKELLTFYNLQILDLLQEVQLTKTYTIGNQTYTYEYNQIILSYNENVALGEPLSFTLTFGD